MSSSKLDNSMKNMLKSLKQDSQKQLNLANDYSFFDDRLKKSDYINQKTIKSLDEPIHNAIKTHPLLAKMNKNSKESSDLHNNKSNNTLKSCSNNKDIKHQDNFFNKEEYEDEDEFYNFDDEAEASQNVKLNESNESYATNNNHNNNNNQFRKGTFKLLSRTDCSENDHNNESMYNTCSSEVKKKFQRANRVFYNGFLNKQDKLSSLPEYQAHAAELLNFLKSLWQTNTMCDLFISVGNKKFGAHKLGLAMFSQKYKEIFTKQQMQNKNTGSFTITLKNSTPIATRDILYYIYTAKIDINPSNAEEILECAKELGIDDLIFMAKDYLSSLSMGDILDFMSNTLNKEGAELMLYELYCYLMTHLDKISRTPEYGKSSITTVRALLNDSHLSVNSELEVFEAALRWINFDKTRQKLIGEITKTVRFTLMTPDELVSKVECQSLLTNEAEVQKMLFNAFKFHALNSTRSNLNGICQREESRNFCLKGASVPDEFIKAVVELSEIAHKLKENRNYTSSNLINCDDSDEYATNYINTSRSKPTRNFFNINNNNNNEITKEKSIVSDEAKLYKTKYEDLTKKMSKVFSKIPSLNETDTESKCSRCKIKK